MERRSFLKSVTAAGLTGTLLTSCASPEEGARSANGIENGTILHSVYFWLKDGLSEDEEKDFLNFFEELRKVPGVQSLDYGKPAPTNPRPVVDNSFQYNLLVTFLNMDDINTYETHPIHTAASEKYSKYWVKVEVRDTIIA
ncbi:Dabb family protein [Sphingobacterium chuzhouense]|uniref:Dabb family protein n=1 Tax=Sphingobacterium chuzhouense TaxID=1742264 RepID=A0ABR7XPG7_9SPHI|nr:Dabb family protein [Sphingobacterium chuzhouense]MBD1421066.1 Dabb family protein [Sphingobacterium chuzhouense]